MAVIQVFNNVKNFQQEIKPSDGTAIIKIFESSPIRSLQNLGLTAKHSSVNSFLKNLVCYSEINSIPESGFPQFELTDSETEKLTKALKVAWDTPRIELQLWDKHNSSAWQPIARVSIQNPDQYPYKTYNLLDLLTDSLSYEMGNDYTLGVQVVDVGWGLIKANDKLVIRGSYTQEIIVVDPEAEVLKQVIVNKPNSVNDEHIGTRAINDSVTIGNTNTGNLTQIINSLAYQIKQITGEADWWRLPAVTLNKLEAFGLLTESQVESILAIQNLEQQADFNSADIISLQNSVFTSNNAYAKLGGAWNTLSLTSNWKSWTVANTFTPGYKLYADGTLEIRGGVIATIQPVAQEIVAVLPVGFRPEKTVYLPSFSTAAVGFIVNTNGNITYSSGAWSTGLLMQGRFSLAVN